MLRMSCRCRIPSSAAKSAVPNTRDDGDLPPNAEEFPETIRGILNTVAKNNIATLLLALSKQHTFWSGIAWIYSALQQRIDGMEIIDLASVTAKLSTFVSVPDPGLLDKGPEEAVFPHATDMFASHSSDVTAMQDKTISSLEASSEEPSRNTTSESDT